MTRIASRPPLLLSLRALALPLLLVAVQVSACASEPPPEIVAVGSKLERVTLHDQNEEPHQIDESAYVIFFAREMEGGKVIRSLLANDPGFLKKHRALYVADISGMPALIANLVAIPKMQEERPYPTLLDRDGRTTAAFPSEEGRVTVMLLDKLRVIGIAYRGSEGGLREAAKRHPLNRSK